MLTDFRQAPLPEIEADLCIVGAGAAGIAIARALAGTGRRICLVESGGLKPDARTQDLYAGECVGVPWGTGLTTSRRRYYGGTTNDWGGGFAPLDPMDLEVRPWVPHSGWPISWGELAPYYTRARPVCGIGNDEFDDPGRLDFLVHRPVAFDPARLVNHFYLRNPRMRFGAVYRAELERAPNVQVLLHANLVEIEVNEAASFARRAVLRALNGRRGTVRARCFVLACGGIENARLLLLSNSVAAHGLGNGHDLVGRYFMDHPRGRLGVVTGAPARLSMPYDHRRGDREASIVSLACLSAAAQQRHWAMNARLWPLDCEYDIPDGIAALRLLADRLRGRGIPDGPAALGRRVAADLPRVLPGLARHLSGRPAVATTRTDLIACFEQAPNPESRVMLGHARDALGQRRVRLDWRLTELDRHTWRIAAAAFAAEVHRLGLGRFTPEPWLHAGADAPPGVEGAAHHIGTTRMADDPRHGVVDRDGRVHGMDNLYIAGSSVFPTGGWVFPTFTIVALALRLADHLRQRLAAPAIRGGARHPAGPISPTANYVQV